MYVTKLIESILEESSPFSSKIYSCKHPKLSCVPKKNFIPWPQKKREFISKIWKMNFLQQDTFNIKCLST